jgi:hypothetical protein
LNSGKEKGINSGVTISGHRKEIWMDMRKIKNEKPIGVRKTGRDS